MARIRNIRPEFFNHDGLHDVAEESGLGPWLRLGFIGLWTQCDFRGVFQWRVKRLNSVIFPYDRDVSMGPILDALESAGFISRFESAGEVFGVVRGFAKHQRVSKREVDQGTNYPEPTGGLRHVEDANCDREHEQESQVRTQEQPGNVPERPGLRTWDVGRRTWDEAAEARERAPEAAAAADIPSTAPAIPTARDDGPHGPPRTAMGRLCADLPPPPYSDLVADYHAIVADGTRWPVVRTVTATVHDWICEVWPDIGETRAAWRTYLVRVRGSPFLMRRLKTPGLRWICRPENFAKVDSGAFDDHETELEKPQFIREAEDAINAAGRQDGGPRPSRSERDREAIRRIASTFADVPRNAGSASGLDGGPGRLLPGGHLAGDEPDDDGLCERAASSPARRVGPA